MTKPQTQSGSIAAYAIAAVVLLALLAGAFYLAKHRAGSSTGDQPNVAQAPAEPSKDAEKSNPKSADKSPQSSSQSPNSQANSNDSKSSSSQSGSHSSDSSSQAVNKSDSSQTSGTIAPAGPTNIIGGVVGLAALAAAITAYLKSRRHLKPLA